MTAVQTQNSSAYITTQYFNQSVYLNIATILSNVQNWANKAIGEVKHELGLFGLQNYPLNVVTAHNINVKGYNGWAINHGAPVSKVGAWNWYLQNKILSGKIPAPLIYLISVKRVHHLHRTQTVRTYGVHNITIDSGGPFPKIGQLNLILNNLMTYTSNLQTELNRVHLPMPSDFVSWVNTIANYGATSSQTSMKGLSLVHLHDSLFSLLKALPSMVADVKKATAAAAAHDVALQQKTQAQAAQNIVAQAASAPPSSATATIIQAGTTAANALNSAANAVQVATATPTAQNKSAATASSANAAQAVSALNSATGKKKHIWPAVLIIGGIAAKAAGLLA